MIGAFIRKELRDVLREKSLVTAFLIQAFLAGFSALLLTGLTALHDPGSISSAPDATVAYVGIGGFDDVLMRTDNLEVIPLPGADAVAAFREGSIDVVVEEVASDADGVRRLTLIFADGELTSTLLVTQFKSLLIDYEEQLRLARQGRLSHDLISMDRTIRPDRPYTFVHTTLLPLLVVTPVFLSGAIAGDALSQESKSRTLMLLRAAPLGALRIVTGKLAVPVLLVPVQVALWLLLFWANGFPTADPWSVLALATLLGVLLTSLGTLVAVWVRDESMTQAAYAVLLMALLIASTTLPQDPLNVIARLATQAADTATWRVAAGMALAAVGSLWVAVMWTARALRADRI